MKSTLLLLALAGLTTSFAQTVIRGPYMQSPTHQSIILMWRTDINTDSKVWYGTDPANLTQSQVINDNIKDHMVQINGLLPYTKYYYAVGTTATQLAGQTINHSFTTHPLPGTQVPVRVWGIGDFGRGNAGQVAVKNSYIDYTGARGTDVWLWLGDNAYDDGSDAQYQSEVFAVNGFSDIFSHVPFWPSPGNHDYNTVWSQSTLFGIPYSNIALADHEGPYFDMVEVPRYAEAGGYPSQHEVFYSYDYGDVHFLSLNSEVFDYGLSYNGINQMKAWIENDLLQNTRKFTIAYFHQPPYSKGSHDSDDIYEVVMKAMREKVIPLLESYDIDLVVCGHSHVFERSFLLKGHYGNSSSFDGATMIMDNTNGNFAQGNPYMKDGTYTTAEGTVYIVCGNSGSTENAPALSHPAMVYTDGGSNAMGSFVIDVYKNRLDGKYLKVTGDVADQFTILKKDVVLAPIANQTICEGGEINVTASFTGGSDSITYAWSPLTSDLPSVTLSPTTNTQYTLTVTDHLTGQVETVSFTVNVQQIQVPVITELIPGTLGTDLTGTGFTYQWSINGNPISGATFQYYTPSFAGSYTLTVTDPNGCSHTSEEYQITSTTGIGELAAEKAFVFPNPAEDQVTLYVPNGAAGERYVIVDAYGKIVATGKTEGQQTAIPLAGYTAGIYILQTEKERFMFTKK